MRTIAYINTPIKAGELHALLSGLRPDMLIDVNEDEVLVIKGN